MRIANVNAGRGRVVIAAVAALSLAAGCSGGGGGPQISTLELATAADTPVTITAAQLTSLADGGAVVSVEPNPDATVAAAPGGQLTFTPNPGFVGTVTVTATVSPAVQLYSTTIPPLATVGGVSVDGSGYGSGWVPVPGTTNEFYGLTDRGPLVPGPDGQMIAAIPSFTPQIGRFALVDGAAQLQRVITLKAPDGAPLSGIGAPNGERIVDLDGRNLPGPPNSVDPEGIAAMPDGTFWVSDDYGPAIIHFDANGVELERLTPGNGLPEVLANRVARQGMHGLAVTPDGSRLVGVMQSALALPGFSADPNQMPGIRIVSIDLASRAVQQFVYLLDDPQETGKLAAGIAAISTTEFLITERDNRLAPGANKSVYRVNVTGATELGEQNPEAIAGAGTTADAQAALEAAGITPATKTIALDLGSLITDLNPEGRFFGHDKVEGLATTDGGRTLYLVNDNDYGVGGVAGPATPFQFVPKILPNGLPDTLEVLRVDTSRLSEPLAPRTITINVGQ